MAGALIVERGLASPAQIAEALEQLRAQGTEFEEILTTQLGLDKNEVRAILADKDAASRVDIGMLLLASGVVGEEQLAEARDRCAATGQPVGPILVEMGAITRLDLASALADQWSGSPAQIIPSPTSRAKNGKAPAANSNELRDAMAALEASIRVARGGMGDGVDALDEVLRREAELTARLAVLEQIVAQPATADPTVTAEIHGIAQGLDALQTSLESVASTDDLAALERAIGDLGTLRAVVDQLTEGLARAASADAVDALAGRVDVVEAGSVETETSLASLGQRVDQLEPLVPRAIELGEQIEHLRASVDGIVDLAGRTEELAGSVADLVDLPTRLEDLAGSVEELRGVVGSHPDAEDELASRLDGVGTAVADLQARVAALDVVPDDLDTLRAAIDKLSAEGKPDAKLAREIAALGERVEALSVEALGPAAEAAVAGVAGRVDAISAAQSDAIIRLEELLCVVDELRAVVESRGSAGDATQIDALVAQVDQRIADAAPASALAALVQAVDELRAAQTPAEERLVGIEARLAVVAEDAESARRSADEALGAALNRVEQVGSEVGGRLDEMLDRITRLEADGPAAGGGDATADESLRAEVAALATALEEAQAAFVKDLKRVQDAWSTERAALEELILARGPRADGDAEGGSVDSAELVLLNRQVERMQDRLVEQERSLVEHFARRERALIERLGAGNDVGQRLSELTRGLEELRVQFQRVSTSGGEGSGNGAEIAEVKEALFSRMERLASSIDWRFQRLEGESGDEAGQSDLKAKVDELTQVVQRLAVAGGVEVEQPTPKGEMFLALVPSPNGHQLIELAGSTPAQGSRIPSPFGEGELEVVAIGTSPLPGDERPCVFVEQSPVAATA